jgi:tetratricopeptide (TPR) repeat protein
VLARLVGATADAALRDEATALLRRLPAEDDPFAARAVSQPSLKKEGAAVFKAGRAHFKKKRWGDALVYFHMGFQLAPDLPGFLRELGQTYEKLGARDKALQFYEEYLRRRPVGKNADAIRAELRRRDHALGTLVLTSSLPCQEVWLEGQFLGDKLPLELAVPPARYQALCYHNKYGLAFNEYAEVTGSERAELSMDWAIVRNELKDPYGRISLESPFPGQEGVMVDLGIDYPETGIALPDDGRALKVILTDDTGRRREERYVKLDPRQPTVIRW